MLSLMCLLCSLVFLMLLLADDLQELSPFLLYRTAVSILRLNYTWGFFTCTMAGHRLNSPNMHNVLM